MSHTVTVYMRSCSVFSGELMNFIACDGLIRKENKKKIQHWRLDRSLRHKFKMQSEIKNSKNVIFQVDDSKYLLRPCKFLGRAPELDLPFNSIYLQTLQGFSEIQFVA